MRLPYHFLQTAAELAFVLASLAILLLCCAMASGQTVSNSLASLNANRAARGLFPLAPAWDLQVQAEREAVIRAERGVSGHLPGGCAPGRAEGVGVRSNPDPYGRQFLACFTDTRRHRYAGAATAVSPRGKSYYVLLLR